jgi:fermentation-respiration switch protein FrsA (DUF1100 family)
VSRLLALALGLAILAAGSFWMRDWLIGSMLYHPTPGADVDPARLGTLASEVWLDTADGVRIHAFFLADPGADRALLYLHGNAGNASHRLPLAEMLRRLGTHVLLLDYRGYGKSGGRPHEAGLYADARAALAHLVEARGLPEARIVVFGSSLGGPVAVELARGRELAGVILESTFSSLSDAGVVHFGRLAAAVTRGRFDAAAAIPEVRAPLLFLHGDRDEIVPHALGVRLFEAAPEPKRFETLAGAGHNDMIDVGGAAYFARIRRFLDEVAPSGAPEP